jgi:hypothetical protein
MSNSYTAGAFFGTYYASDSEEGKILHRILDSNKPLKGFPLVEVSICGVWNGSPCWYTVQLRKPSLSFGRHDEPARPVMLTEQNAAPVQDVLVALGLSHVATHPIGWYFAGSVS